MHLSSIKILNYCNNLFWAYQTLGIINIVLSLSHYFFLKIMSRPLNNINNPSVRVLTLDFLILHLSYSCLVPFIIFDIIVFLGLFLPSHHFRNAIYRYPIKCVPSSLHKLSSTFAWNVCQPCSQLIISHDHLLLKTDLPQEGIKNYCDVQFFNFLSRIRDMNVSSKFYHLLPCGSWPKGSFPCQTSSQQTTQF